MATSSRSSLSITMPSSSSGPSASSSTISVASSSSSSSPSSSAVTLMRPGKSILKQPPPPPQSFFSLSRFTKLLPSQSTSSNSSTVTASTFTSLQSANTTRGPGIVNHADLSGADSSKAKAKENHLKRAHFVLPNLTIVYPISTANPPCMPTTKEEKRAAELRENERRKRIVRGNTTPNSSYAPSIASGDGDTEKSRTAEQDEWWSMDKVEAFYRECCEGREEAPFPGISTAFKRAASPRARAIDLSGVQLTFGSASALSDVFAIEWGLRKLVLRECDLDEHTLKPILHTLLIPNTLAFLSVASNRKLKAPAFKLIGSFVDQATSLEFLDLSLNTLDKKSVEYIVSALRTAEASGGANQQVGDARSGSSTGLVSLKLDDCSLRPAALDILAHTIRTSSLRNISLRHNRIQAAGAVALALMIKDYPDAYPTTSSLSTPSFPSSATSSPTGSSLNLSLLSSGSTTPTTGAFDAAPSPTGTPGFVQPTIGPAPRGPYAPPLHPHSQSHMQHTSLPPPPHHPSPTSPLRPHAGPNLPPPRHPTSLPIQTTYTPYIPKRRAAAAAAVAGRGQAIAAQQQQQIPAVPLITSSAQGGITMRHSVPANLAYPPARVTGIAGSAAGSVSHSTLSSPTTTLFPAHGTHGPTHDHHKELLRQGPSTALLDKVRALDSLPRLGDLRTLDLRGNDIRSGVTYIAQVLKRNRTLKVLNLSENKIDVQGLVVIAEALKYNSNLETLDLSRNPCSGPSLDGIQSLRTAFTLNSSLKRLFLPSTSLSSAGAIALAEFLPESSSLLHLDLTDNNLDLAGVMALSEGLKANHVMRCLDVNIPPGDDEYARMCREILNTCVRNTEVAEKSSQARGTRKAMWGMIEESELAKSIKQKEEKKAKREDVVTQVKECIASLRAGASNSSSSPTSSSSSSLDSELLQHAKSLLPLLATLIQNTADADLAKVEELLVLNDELMNIVHDPHTFVLEEKSRKVQVVTGPSVNGETATIHSFETSESASSENFFDATLGITNTMDDGSSDPPSKINGKLISLDLSEANVLDGVMESDEDPDLSPATPRLDKGKARAEPEPEHHEKILSPNVILHSDDEDDEDGNLSLMERQAMLRMGLGLEVEEALDKESIANPSPIDRSRSWVAEEGEILRRGNMLLSSEEMEHEYDSDKLRQELLEAQVERPPPRPLDLVDEFSMDMDSAPGPLSPSQIALPMSPTQESKPNPRPYISRNRSLSSNSLNGLNSPVLSSPSISPIIEDAKGLTSPTSPGTRPYIPRRKSSNQSLDTQ